MSVDRLSDWAARSITLKVAALGFLMLLLLIPAGMISSTIYERQNLRTQAENDITSKWGSAQRLSGPWITVPYRIHGISPKGEPTLETGFATFLPETLNIQGKVDTEKRHRGIYEAVLFKANLDISGTFARFNPASLGIPPLDRVDGDHPGEAVRPYGWTSSFSSSPA